MRRLNRIARLFMFPTGALLLLGTVLVWASQSWFALVWAQALDAFPGERARVLMVNTEATFPRQAKYLPEEFQHNIALRAIVIDKNDRVRAIVYRSAALTLYPEGNERFDSRYYCLRAFSRADACFPIGIVLIAVAALQSVLLIIGWRVGKKSEIDH